MSLVIDETNPSKVAAVFETEQAARIAQQHLIEEGGFTADSVNLIHPDDAHLSQKIEPKSHQVAGTLVKSHLTLGMLGLLTGLLLAILMIAVGPAMTRSSPLLTLIVFLFFGGIFGLMAAGAVSIRPDQDPLITQTVEAHREHQWTVIVQAKNSEEADRAESLLTVSAVDTKESL